MKLLVTGGAGYVGSVTSRLLLDAGHEVVVIDNLRTGFREAVAPDATFVEADIRDAGRVLTPDAGFDAVLHFAGLIQAGESMTKPEKYWDENMIASLALLDAVRAANVPTVVFSSTAAVYGNPSEIPITENATKAPTNTYGATKLAFDYALTSEAFGHRLGAVSLRYFNVAGAYIRPDGTQIGERHDPETHLIPITLQVAAGKREKLQLFGDDYPTPDGTGVRDYIHVVDLARGHLQALNHMASGCRAVNLGTGQGYSVMDVVEAYRRVSGQPIPVEIRPRRPGDQATCYAEPSLAHQLIDWQAEHDLARMIADSWRWTQQNPGGYES